MTETILSLSNILQSHSADLLALVAKRFDIEQNLFDAYYADGKPVKNAALAQADLAQALYDAIYHRLFTPSINMPLTGIKYANLILKLSDYDAITPNQSMIQTCHQWLQQLQPVLSPTPILTNIESAEASDYKTLPVTMLFYEGVIARAYCEITRHMGFRFQKIIQLIPCSHKLENRPNGLLTTIAQSFAEHDFKRKIHHWPHWLLCKHLQAIQAMQTSLMNHWQVPATCLNHALRSLNHYSDTIIPIRINGLKSNNLLHQLVAEPSSTLLYSGGGIMPQSLLDLPHLRFIHIHPGFLPNIRGADCALWSKLLSGNASASAFYMKPGIDMGEIIAAHYLPNLLIKADAFTGLKGKNLYRAFYGTVDPWIRAKIWQKLLNDYMQNPQMDFYHLPSQPQQHDDGVTYHFMHPYMQNLAFNHYLSA